MKVIFASVPFEVAVTPDPIKLIEVNVVPIPTPSSFTSIPVSEVLMIVCIVSILVISCQSTPDAVETNSCPVVPD